MGSRCSAESVATTRGAHRACRPGLEAGGREVRPGGLEAEAWCGGFGRRLWGAEASSAVHHAPKAPGQPLADQTRALPGAVRARTCAHLGERDRDTCTHLLLRTHPGGRVGGEGKVRSARAQQGDREGGAAAVKKRPCGCPAAPPWVPPAALTRSEARQQPAILLGPALWAGSGRAAERERGGGEGGEATLRKRGPHTCTRARARIIDPCAFLHAEATWLRARRRRHQGHREDLARKVLRPGRLVRGVLTSYFFTENWRGVIWRRLRSDNYITIVWVFHNLARSPPL